MGSEDNIIITNRSELIKRARESCSNNLSSSRGKNQNSKDAKSNKEQYEDGRINAKYKTSANTLDMKTVSVKLFMIRLVCAVILFLFVVAIDQYKLTYNDLDSDTIKDYIISNESVTKAVEYVSSVVGSLR